MPPAKHARSSYCMESRDSPRQPGFPVAAPLCPKAQPAAAAATIPQCAMDGRVGAEKLSALSIPAMIPRAKST